MFAPNRGFSESGNQAVSFKFLLDPPLLPWQQDDVIWTQNRPLLSLHKRYHQDAAPNSALKWFLPFSVVMIHIALTHCYKLVSF